MNRIEKAIMIQNGMQVPNLSKIVCLITNINQCDKYGWNDRKDTYTLELKNYCFECGIEYTDSLLNKENNKSFRGEGGLIVNLA
jgi:hypothetical protein